MSDPVSKPSWQPDGEGEHDETLEDNWLFRLRRERFRSRASGKSHDFYIMRLADAVSVIALTPDHQLVLVRQFRAGSGRDSLEAPGGLLDPDEDPCAAGARELLEETGYAGDPPDVLGTVWSNPSIMSSRTTTIVIANARRVAEPRLDQGEEVVVELVPARLVPRLIQDGRIDHALVVCGLLWWLLSRFPGPLAKAGPSWPWRIRTIMLAIGYCAVCLALLMNLSTLLGAIAALLGFPLALFYAFTSTRNSFSLFE